MTTQRNDNDTTPRTPAPLDADLLEEALDNCYEARYGRTPFSGSTTVGGAFAPEIAAEYARIAAAYASQTMDQDLPQPTRPDPGAKWHG